MRLRILARLVVVVVSRRVASSSRRLGWVRETDRIASRTARPDADEDDLRIHTSRDATTTTSVSTTTCLDSEEIYRARGVVATSRRGSRATRGARTVSMMDAAR